MRSILKNRILRTGLLGFFVLAIFLSPVSLTLTTGTHVGNNYPVVQSTINVVHAVFDLTSIGQTAFNNVGFAFLQFVSLLTRAGGVLLDTALTETVFKMGANANSSNLKPTIDNLWSLIRDICNLVFIFGFIYIGIRTIIDPDSATMKRFLSRIIIGALLINFSLFFAKAIIDFSNFTAYQLYEGMTSGTGSLTETIMKQLGGVTFYQPSGIAAVKDNGFAFFLMASLFLIVTAFVFFAGALILIVRFVALIIIMIASPLLFAATVFPQTESMASDLWKKLISYSFLAPIYILLVLISIKLLEGMSFGSKDMVAAITGSSNVQQGVSNVGAILNFTVAIFFMISSLTIATKMGGKGGEMAVGFANNLRGRMQGAIGRKFVGGTSHWAREKYEKMDANLGNMKGRLAPLGKAAQWTLGATGADRTIRETFQAGEHAKFGSKYSYEDDEKYDKERKKRQAEIQKMDAFRDGIASGVDRDGNLLPLSDEKRIAFERKVADASMKEFEELSQEQRKALVGLMTDSQIEAMEKSDKLTDSEKHELSIAREKHIQSMYSAGEVENLSKAGIGHLSTLGYSFLSQEDRAVRLTSSQMDDLKKKMTPTEFRKLSEKRDEAFLKLAQGAPIQTYNAQGATSLTHEFIKKLKPKEVSSLSTKILVELATKGNLPVNALESIKKDATKSSPDEVAIRQAIDAARSAGVDVSAHDEFFSSPLGKNFGK